MTKAETEMAGKKPAGLENAKYTKAVRFHPDHLCIIGVDTKDGPEHPDYDPRVLVPLDPDMVASIKAEGVTQTVSIALVDGQPVVMDGRRRVLHARAALKELKPAERETSPAAEVECKVHPKLDDKQRARFSIVANNFRLNDDPVTEAEKAAKLTSMAISDEEIQRDFGWSVGTLRNRRKLLELPKGVLNLVRTGKLQVTAALKFAGMEPGEAQEAARKLAESGGSRQSRDAGKAVKERRASADETEGPSYERPGLRLLQRIVKREVAAKPDERLISDDIRKALAFVIGELDPASVSGLKAVIKAVTPEPKVKEKKAPTNRADGKGKKAE